MDKCKGKLNKYCYCCGRFKESDGRLNDEFKLLYTAYFDQPFIADKWYAPNGVCKTCYGALADWKLSDGRNQMKFGVPMLWSEPNAKQHDPSDCYVCANFIHRPKKGELQNLVYKSVESAKTPVAHSVANVPYKYPSTPESSDASSNEESADEDDDKKDPSYDTGKEDNTPQRLDQADMDFLAVRLKLTQENAKFLFNQFNKKGALMPGVVIPNVKEIEKTTKRTDKVFYVPPHKKDRKPKGQK